jgi:hypothetical protein
MIAALSKAVHSCAVTEDPTASYKPTTRKWIAAACGALAVLGAFSAYEAWQGGNWLKVAFGISAAGFFLWCARIWWQRSFQ